MRARVDTIGGHCLAWLEVLFAVWCVGLLGLAGFWPLAFWTAGLSLGCVMLALLILCWFGAPCGMWDPDGVVKSPHDSSPSKSLMFHFQFCRPTIFGIRGFAQMRSPGWRCGWTWICTTSRRGAGCSPCRSMPSCGKWCWPFVLLFAACFRFGEALHPGPAGLGADTWSLGIANPSGLNGKLDQLNAFPGDAWLLSETQALFQGSCHTPQRFEDVEEQLEVCYTRVTLPCQKGYRHWGTYGGHGFVKDASSSTAS